MPVLRSHPQMWLLAASSAAATAAAYPGTCHVTVDAALGNDAADGVTQPVRSLLRAQHLVRSMPRPLPVGGVAVCVSAGVYEPLVLGPQDSGDAPDRRITWTGLCSTAPCAVLSGGVRVPFSPSGGVVWTANLFDAGVTDLGAWTPHGFLVTSCTQAPGELWSDGVAGPGSAGFGTPFTVARWPNVPQPDDPASAWRNATAWTRAEFNASAPTRKDALRVSADAPFGAWTLPSGNWTWQWAGNPFWDWGDAVVPVVDFDNSSRTMYLQAGLLPDNVTFGAKYFIQNAVEALDAPREYYVNATSGQVAWIPPADTTEYAWFSVNSTALSMTGASFLTFQGLSAMFTRADGVIVTDSRDIQFVNCSISGVGTTGLLAIGSTAIVISGVNVTYAGGQGIDIYGGGNRTSLTSGGIVVSNCVVQYFGRRCASYSAGIGVASVGALVSHNDIGYAPHMCVGWLTNDATVEFNIIHDCVLASCDMGAIYNGANDWSVWNVTIRNNLFYRNGWTEVGCNMQTGSDIVDVYFDECESGVTIVGNVHWTPVPKTPFSYLAKQVRTYANLANGGSTIAVSNALVIDVNTTFFHSITGLTDGASMYCNASGAWITGMITQHWDEGVYAARYPVLAGLNDSCGASPAACAASPACPAAPYRVSVTSMANVNVSIPFTTPNVTLFPPSMFNTTGQWTGLDPGFEDPDARTTLNFQLRPDSPIYAALPGFQRIPMECFGPWACPSATP